MVGLGGSVYSLVLIAVFERGTLAAIHWDGATVGLLLGYVLCLFAMYVLTAVGASGRCSLGVPADQRRCGVQHASADVGCDRLDPHLLHLRRCGTSLLIPRSPPLSSTSLLSLSPSWVSSSTTCRCRRVTCPSVDLLLFGYG